MFDPREKVALFIDGANLYATARSLAVSYTHLTLPTICSV